MSKITFRTWTIIFAGVALLALFLLAASISTLQFDPGQPISFQKLAPQFAEQGASGDISSTLAAFLRVLLILMWIMVPLYLILLIFSKDARKRFLRDMIMMLPFLILLYILSNNQQLKKAAEELNPAFMGMQNDEIAQLTPAPPLPEFVPPAPWVTTAVIVGLSLTVVAVIASFLYFLWRRAKKQSQDALVVVRREAQAALDDIQSGGDLRDAIMRSYLQMVEAIREYRGINRERDMTPHEFEMYLGRRGLPVSPVHQLTQLFETVRYGGVTPGRKEEQAAVTSLRAIINACQKPGGQ